MLHAGELLFGKDFIKRIHIKAGVQHWSGLCKEIMYLSQHSKLLLCRHVAVNLE